VLAIKHETKGRGPVTQMMISVTMLLDMIVLVIFAISQNIVIAACPMEGISISMAKSTMSVFGSVLLWAACGVLLGLFLQAVLFYIPGDGPQGLGLIGNLVKPVLIVTTGGASFYALLALNKLFPTLGGGFELLRVDPLLVCMIAAIWVSQMSLKGDGFGEILEDVAHLIMPPFFTIAGATLDVESIVANWKAPPVLFTIRFIALAVGSYVASTASGQSDVLKQQLWKTLQSQSGVTLGLVAQMQMGLMGEQPWAKGTAAIIIGCVVMNQLVGPTMCREGIRSAGESNEEDDTIDMTKLQDELANMGPDRDLQPEFRDAESFRPCREDRRLCRQSLRKESALSSVKDTQNIRPRTGSVLTVIGEFNSGISEVTMTRQRMSSHIPEGLLMQDDQQQVKSHSLDVMAEGGYFCCRTGPEEPIEEFVDDTAARNRAKLHMRGASQGPEADPAVDAGPRLPML